mmetsp:Transcript_9209/g.17790  ORF Transcript_9209/g.17790 Transcript_9209/m.17790 type:complete len:1083 (+) Transcript_9209:64-3312(+)
MTTISKDEEASSHQSQNDPQNFTPIQSRRFRRTTSLPCWSLCPSMDLIALGTGAGDGSQSGLPGNGGGSGDDSPAIKNPSSPDNGSPSDFIEVADSIAVHRIVSWQKLLAINKNKLTLDKEEDADFMTLDDDEKEDLEWDLAQDAGGSLWNNSLATSEKVTKLNGATSICWSPDGKCIAVGLADGGVLIHDVEPDTSDSGGADAAGGESADHHLIHVIRRPPMINTFPSSLVKRALQQGVKPTSSLNDVPLNDEKPVSKSNQNVAMFSPRVTRSMAAKRGRVIGTNHLTEKKNAEECNAATANSKISSEEREVDNKQSELQKERVTSLSPAVIGLAWNKVASNLTSWDQSSNEWETNNTWKYTSQLVDRGRYFLPQGSYPNISEGKNSSEIAKAWGNPVAPLNVLCVVTQDGLHWYLQGLYRIMSILHLSNLSGSKRIKMTFSPDLSAMLVTSDGLPSSIAPRNDTINANLYLAPLFAERRFDLQILTSSYRSIFFRLRGAKTGIRASLTAWQSALRPLDVKFQSLFRLICKYNVVPQNQHGNVSDIETSSEFIRRELLRFILSGQSTISGEVSNAFDQFFTGATFHDQLFQREARGIDAGVASVEGNLRNNVLTPVRALVYETEELYGMAKARGCKANETPLLDPQCALRLYTSARILYLTLERCLAAVVEARSRVNDFLAWIRGTASQVRARGTASDSVQRQNARDRRVPNGVLQRVSDFLSLPMMHTCREAGDKTKIARKLTECIIGAPVSDFFVGDSFSTDIVNENAKRACTLKSALELTFHSSAVLFNQPRILLSESVKNIDLRFEVKHSQLAIHTRRGAWSSKHNHGGIDEGITPNTFFKPHILNMNDGMDRYRRNWMILARSLGRGEIVEVVAIPGCDASENHKCEYFPDYYLRSSLNLPDHYEVTNIAFYGDDGNSSPHPHLDTGTPVRRQALGLTVRHAQPTSEEGTVFDEELWIVHYDSVLFQRFESNNTVKSELAVTDCPLSAGCCASLRITHPVDERDEMETGIFFQPKRRVISTRITGDERNRASQLQLCASRGTGGVVTFGASTVLDIFDLEEDEESDEESESESFDD